MLPYHWSASLRIVLSARPSVMSWLVTRERWPEKIRIRYSNLFVTRNTTTWIVCNQYIRWHKDIPGLRCRYLLTTREAAWYLILIVSVCMSVCLSVSLSDDNFRKPWRRKFIFTVPVHLLGIRVKFIYEGHRVKVKVTGA